MQALGTLQEGIQAMSTLSNLNTSTSSIAITSDVEERALEVARMLSADPNFGTHMTQIMDAKELDKRGPVVVLQDLEKIIPAEMWGAIPKAGSTKHGTGKDTDVGSNEPYDKWTIKDHSDGGKTVNFSFFKTLAANVQPEGPWLEKKFEDLKAVTVKEPDPKNDEQRDMLKWTKLKRLSMKARIKARRDAFRQVIEQACGVRTQLAAVSAVPGVSVVLLRDENGEIMITSAPIGVFETAQPMKCQEMTVRTFLKLKPTEASVIGYDSLIETLARDTGTSGETSDTPSITAGDFDAFENYVSEIGAFVDVQDNLAGLKKWFNKGTKEEIAEKLQNFGDAMIPLFSLWAAKRADYDKLQQDQQAAA